jgi:hypothetical protein
MGNFIAWGKEKDDYSDGFLEMRSMILVPGPAATPLWRKLLNPLIVACAGLGLQHRPPFCMFITARPFLTLEGPVSQTGLFK